MTRARTAALRCATALGLSGVAAFLVLGTCAFLVEVVGVRIPNAVGWSLIAVMAAAWAVAAVLAVAALAVPAARWLRHSLWPWLTARDVDE